MNLQISTTTSEWLAVAKEFETKWNFPHCIGALDGKHIMIQPPKGSGSPYYNYKGTHSVILLALVNANYEFLFADVGSNGRSSDGGVWRDSKLKKMIDENALGIPAPEVIPGSHHCLPYVIVGDDAFPLSQNLMKPYPFRDQSDSQRIFSYRLSRARRTVENAFGILANKFRVLLSPINLHPKKVEVVILSCLALHNLLRRTCPDYAMNVDAEKPEEGVVIPGDWRSTGQLVGLERHGRNMPVDAKIIREKFTDYFMNEGAVPWQHDMTG